MTPNANSDGTITACDLAGCGRRCCDFSAGNYIVLYPGELNRAIADGASVAHLEIRPAGEGGHRAICRAGDTATCDRGYKPLDCATYPYFPTPAGDSAAMERFGAKCPLAEARLAAHRRWSATAWAEVVRGSAAVRRWLRRVPLLGYRRSSVVGPRLATRRVLVSSHTPAASNDGHNGAIERLTASGGPFGRRA